MTDCATRTTRPTLVSRRPSTSSILLLAMLCFQSLLSTGLLSTAVAHSLPPDYSLLEAIADGGVLHAAGTDPPNSDSTHSAPEAPSAAALATLQYEVDRAKRLFFSLLEGASESTVAADHPSHRAPSQAVQSPLPGVAVARMPSSGRRYVGSAPPLQMRFRSALQRSSRSLAAQAIAARTRNPAIRGTRRHHRSSHSKSRHSSHPHHVHHSHSNIHAKIIPPPSLQHRLQAAARFRRKLDAQTTTESRTQLRASEKSWEESTNVEDKPFCV